MSRAAILGFARTPFGAQNGSLRELPPEKLGSTALCAAGQRAGVDGAAIERVVLGTVLDAGRGPNPGRVVVLEAGFTEFAAGPPALAVRAGGGAGLEALAIAASELEGDRAVAALGADSASQAPYLLPEARAGSRLGAGRLLDGAAKDAWDSSDEELPLPALAAIALQSLEVSRAQFLEARALSVARARAAAGKGEIAPVAVHSPSGAEVALEADDLPGAKDASPGDEAYAARLADGAAALVISTPERARALGRADAPRLLAVARAAVETRKAPLAPVAALRALLVKTGRKVADLRVVEVDESLFVAPLVARRELSLDLERLNPRGGAHAYGHAGGACGLRALVAALAELDSRGGGLAAVAYGTGVGGGIAVLVER
ncbi:hypothetical protein HY251_03830 [bacterium]|nr:hypothetical protein [bacterium]